MNTYLMFDSKLRDQISWHGLKFEWLTSLFLGEARFESIPPLSESMPLGQKQFYVRQTLASDLSYVNVYEGCFSCPDPWTAGARCKALVCLTADKKDNLPFEMVPIFYKFKSANGEEFWICVYWTFGRVTQIFFPNRHLVIFDISKSDAEAVIDSLNSFLSRYSGDIAVLMIARDRVPPKCVGLLDMVTNFGHQAINHLSGVQRLVDLALVDKIDELWVSGTRFFGQVESLFPELDGRVRYFADRWGIASELLREPRQIIRIGSTYLSSELKRRIFRNVRVSIPKGPNILVVTVRASGRTCVNLPEVVGEMYKRLRSRFDLRIALDGWVLPESALVAASSVGAAVSHQYVNAIRNEIALAKEIQDRLPSGSIIINTIGRSMFESLNELTIGTVYFSHIGTLQHKLGMLLGLPGVVHGPKWQISNPEGGAYLSEDGVPPVFISADAVEDIPTLSSRGQSFSDYRIVDMARPTEQLACLMDATT